MCGCHSRGVGGSGTNKLASAEETPVADYNEPMSLGIKEVFVFLVARVVVGRRVVSCKNYFFHGRLNANGSRLDVLCASGGPDVVSNSISDKDRGSASWSSCSVFGVIDIKPFYFSCSL